jgi:uncharacterized phage protein gp47/JayE
MHTPEPLVCDPRFFEVEIAIAKLKTHKSSDTNKILAELFQERSETLWSEVHKLINSV